MESYQDDLPEGWSITDSGIVTAASTTAVPASSHTHTFSIPVHTSTSIPQGTIYVPTYQWDVTPYKLPEMPDPVYEQPIVPLFADAVTVKATLQRQLLVLESLQEDGPVGPLAGHLADAIFFINETIEALEKIIDEA